MNSFNWYPLPRNPVFISRYPPPFATRIERYMQRPARTKQVSSKPLITVDPWETTCLCAKCRAYYDYIEGKWDDPDATAEQIAKTNENWKRQRQQPAQKVKPTQQPYRPQKQNESTTNQRKADPSRIEGQGRMAQEIRYDEDEDLYDDDDLYDDEIYDKEWLEEELANAKRMQKNIREQLLGELSRRPISTKYGKYSKY